MEDEKSYQRFYDTWDENSYGFNMQRARGVATNGCKKVTFESDKLLSEPVVLATLDYSHLVSLMLSLVGVSMASSLLVCVLIYRLYGGTVAAMFAVVSLEWIQVSVLGGSEPVFMVFLLGSFIFARKERWESATVLASLAITVRCVAVFALLGFFVVLWRKRQWRELSTVLLISICVGVAYAWFAHRITGDALINLKLYRPDWGASGLPITIPFKSLAGTETTAAGIRWFNQIKPLVVVIASVLLAAVAWARRRPSGSLRYLQEAIATGAYLVFLVSYNFDRIAWAWPRLVIPAIPLLLYAVRDYLPADRRLIWSLAALSSFIACTDVVGINSVFGFHK